VPRRSTLRLVLIAAVCFAVVGLIALSPARHDPLWWRHAGLPEHHPHLAVKDAHGDVAAVTGSRRRDGNVGSARPRTPEEHQKYLAAPRHAERHGVELRGNNVDYTSDYDIDNVTLTDEFPEGGAPTNKTDPLWFRYVDPSRATHKCRYVSDRPRILVVPGFLSHAECDAIIHQANKSMWRSMVAVVLNSSGAPVDDTRTSTQTFISKTDAVAAPILARLINLTGFDLELAEDLQVLRYTIGEKYDAHNDFFDPRLYGAQADNRALTAFYYLNDVADGGESWFPLADGKRPNGDYRSCTHGFRVKPKKGMMVIFYDMQPNGETDEWSLHGGCPPKSGTKWGGTQWLHIATGGN
jgi:prolyl 4-hydroxylase